MLTDIWPNLTQIWCFDQEYISPKQEEVESELESGLWLSLLSDNTLADCDDWALHQHSKVKMKYNWAFGEAFANNVRGWSVVHNLNICCCQEGVILLDTKQKAIWVPNQFNDNILWVRF